MSHSQVNIMHLHLQMHLHLHLHMHLHLRIHLHLHLQLHLHMQPVNVGLINMAMDSWVPCLEEFTDYFKLHYTTGGRTCTCTC